MVQEVGDDLRLLGMQHQLAGRKAVGKRAP
jgi:hypothetical protein